MQGTKEAGRVIATAEHRKMLVEKCLIDTPFTFEGLRYNGIVGDLRCIVGEGDEGPTLYVLRGSTLPGIPPGTKVPCWALAALDWEYLHGREVSNSQDALLRLVRLVCEAEIDDYTSPENVSVRAIKEARAILGERAH